MFATGAANLAQVLIDIVLRAPLTNTERYVRDTVSLWGATALVGLPVWLLHWLWVQRFARSDPSERTSALRRLYLYAVLVGATLAIGSATHDMLLRLRDAVVGVSPTMVNLDAIGRPLP